MAFPLRVFIFYIYVQTSKFTTIVISRILLISNGMKNKFFILIVLAIAGSAIFLRYGQARLPSAEVIIGGRWITAEAAISPSARERGLSGRTGLKEGSGMLFIFPEKGIYPFWMKGMLFPIDIVWIDGNAIVDIAPNLPPPLEASLNLQLYQPRAAADYVLEVPAGLVSAAGWKIGDGVVINFK